MNFSFLCLGVAMIIGSLIFARMMNNRSVPRGFSLFAVGGFGTVLVGLFPENTVSTVHVFGAALAFLVGNVGLVILGYSLHVSKILKIYTLLSGMVALCALGFFVSGHYVGLGYGGMERIVAYPQTIWMIIVGFYFLRVKSP